MALGNSGDMHQNVKRNETIGAFAAAVWLVSGFFLFAESETASFSTWQGAVYFLVGTSLAAILFGVAFHRLERRASGSLAALVGDQSRSLVRPMLIVAFVVIAMETVVVFLTSSLVVYGLLF